MPTVRRTTGKATVGSRRNQVRDAAGTTERAVLLAYVTLKGMMGVPGNVYPTLRTCFGRHHQQTVIAPLSSAMLSPGWPAFSEVERLTPTQKLRPPPHALRCMVTGVPQPVAVRKRGLS